MKCVLYSGNTSWLLISGRKGKRQEVESIGKTSKWLFLYMLHYYGFMLFFIIILRIVLVTSVSHLKQDKKLPQAWQEHYICMKKIKNFKFKSVSRSCRYYKFCYYMVFVKKNLSLWSLGINLNQSSLQNEMFYEKTYYWHS